MDDELLNILQAHGEAFLSSFSGTKEILKKKSSPIESKAEEEEEEEEWQGIGSDRDVSESEEDYEENDDEFTSATTSAKANVIVFSDISSTSNSKKDPATKSQLKALMSSKISKLREEVRPESKRPSETTDEDLKERSNLQNDALLHKLVHTKLLSGSLNSELELTPAQRRKALSGRVLELSGDAKLGRGERSVRIAEHNKASKRVREGLMQKQKERRSAQLEETKNLGNYHPTLKRLFDADSETKPKKRVRGLQMGIGSFKGGTLRLSREEISSVQGHRGGASSRGRGGNGRGRGRRGRK